MNKDFFSRLPSMVCESLDGYWIKNYGAEPWFEEAWEEYRQYILNTEDIMEMRMPGFVFNKYLKKGTANAK
jgi:hypothetical protein